MGFARAWGYEGIVVVNLFAYRATRPKNMMVARDPVGLYNYDAITNMVRHVALTNKELRGPVVCAWGANGSFMQQGETVRSWIENEAVTPHHLGLTKQGQPRHPLYLRGDTKPIPWQEDNPNE